MVTTSRTELWDAMWAFYIHGKTHEAFFGREPPPGFPWLHERFGSNFRLTELQSAIGLIQLQPDPPPPPSPGERGKLVRDTLRALL
jgi:dTDP-4-amino-4,6-dideoxygalactose transaminase